MSGTFTQVSASAFIWNVIAAVVPPGLGGPAVVAGQVNDACAAETDRMNTKKAATARNPERTMEIPQKNQTQSVAARRR
ncbi:hypothetical protein [Hasllibacter sp. MH4015]|uniref:hypothetical protein n=1 Tax=Hasllibacter sp. MH4015 TaxID=2854029 RepID=UPI001CD800FA|nr:hypothetical protein [Hasllibacter sp. MH4015]